MIIKWRKNDDKNDDHDDACRCFLFNRDHNQDHVQTLVKISVRIANGHSWLIITPYLVKYKKWFSIAFECQHVNVITNFAALLLSHWLRFHLGCWKFWVSWNLKLFSLEEMFIKMLAWDPWDCSKILTFDFFNSRLR